MKKYPKKEFEKNLALRIFILISIALLIAVLSIKIASAASLGERVRGVGGYFSDYASSDEPSFLDFLMMAVVFSIAAGIGFSQVFKEAKAANLGLGIAVGITLSIALVFGGNITLKKFLPFSIIILFILLFIGLFALLKKAVFTGNTAGSSILAGIFAIIISIALIALGLSFICSGDNCENNSFLRRIFGSESALGGIFSELGDSLDEATAPPTAGTADTEVPPTCGNSQKDPGEECDAGLDGAESSDCKSGEFCYGCHCTRDSVAGKLLDNWYWFIIILVPLILGIWKRKNIKEAAKKAWRALPSSRFKKERKAFIKMLKLLGKDEKEAVTSFRKLCETVGKEKKTFEDQKHIVDTIVTDIKDTIGGEISFVKDTEVRGGNLSKKIESLKRYNEHIEKDLINKIIANLVSQLSVLNSIAPELKKSLDEIENAADLFNDHELLSNFRNYNMREKNTVTNMQGRIEDNRVQLEKMLGICKDMVEKLVLIEGDAEKIADKEKKNYDEIIAHIKDIRNNALRLNMLFSNKISLLHYLAQRMEDVKKLIHDLHENERNNLVNFLNNAKACKEHGAFDSAIYFASQIIANGEELRKAELDEESERKLMPMIDEAKKIIEASLPNVFESMKPKIIEELKSRKYSKLRKMSESIKEIWFIEKYFKREFERELNIYALKMENLGILCDKLERGEAIRQSLLSDLGL